MSLLVSTSVKALVVSQASFEAEPRLSLLGLLSRNWSRAEDRLMLPKGLSTERDLEAYGTTQSW